MADLKLALRTLRRTPFVTVVAVLSLALGIGANAAIFSLFNQILLRPLPVSSPETLVNFGTPGPKMGSTSCNNAGRCDEIFSYPMYKDLERQQTVFAGLAGHRTFGANVKHGGETQPATAMLVTGTYFPVLGLRPTMGRLIEPGDDRVPGETAVVVLSHGYWRTRFLANPAVLNETILINGHPMTVVGVGPAGFEGTTLGTKAAVFLPVTLRSVVQPGFRPVGFENRQNYWLYAFGRLKPGVPIEQARAAIGAQYSAIINGVEAPLQKGMSEQTLTRFKAKEITVTPGERGQSDVGQEAGPALWLLMGVTVFVLLIACANIANLMLARAAARSGEMAVRLSIGAGRWSLVRQLLTEALVIALMGGLAGLLVARWTLSGIRAMMPAEVAETLGAGLSIEVLLFAGALSVTTGLLFGLFPALHSSRPDLLSVLKGQSGQPAGAKSAKWFRLSLATFQIFVSMMLLGGAGLFVKSLYNVSRVDLGIDISRVATFSLAPERNGYPTERSRQLFTRIEDELARQPGVASVAAATVPILGGSNWGRNVSVQGFASGPDVDSNSSYNEVGPGYFKTLGVPLLSGREFTASDVAGSAKVAIVNEQFAKKFNLGRDAVGKRMALGNGPDLDIEIVGLAQNAKYSEVRDEIPPVFFLPYRQVERVSDATFYVRTMGDPSPTVGAIRPFVRGIDSDLPVEELRTLPQQVSENVFQDRIVSILAASFAGLATILAAVGLYGVLAYTVSQRTREFGLRMALGAAPSRVRTLVMKQVFWMTAVGGVLGVIGAGFVGRQMASLLFEMEGHDPMALGSAAVVLGLVALAAGFVPALRASRLDPMKALRFE